MFIKTVLFCGLAVGSMAFGQHLITATRRLMAGELALAHINPYATARAQNAQIAAALAQVNQARAGVQQAPQP